MIVFIGNTMWSMLHFRKHVIEHYAKFNEVAVIAPFDGFETKFNDDVNCVDINLKPTGKDILSELRTLLELNVQLFRSSPEAVICYGLKPILYSIIFRLRSGRVSKFIYVFPGLGRAFMATGIFSILLRCLVRILLRRVTVVVLNPSDFNFVGRLCSPTVDLKQMNGEGVSLTQTVVRKKKYDFLFSGRLIKEKGIVDFLNAFDVIKNEYPNSSTCVIGSFYDGDVEFELNIRKRMEELGVNFYGFVSNPIQYIANSKFLVFPSRYPEGLPMVVLEAMSVGCLPIVYPNPGTDHVVFDDHNGFVANPSPSNLAEKMKMACNITLSRYNKLVDQGIVDARRFSEEAVIKFYRDQLL